MSELVRFPVPFVVFLGDITSETFSKTGLGLVQWRRRDCVGQIRLPGCSVDAGVRDLTVQEARAAGARSLIVGSAAVGGALPEGWLDVLCEAARSGLHIVAGLHSRLAALPGLAAGADAGGVRLFDVRIPPPEIPVGTGRKRNGRRLLTVGTDCACGKKYTALALDVELRRRGIDSTFRATGQTGIMIAGEGIPIDAVVADFLTGAAEMLSPQAPPGHWDVIEGQGSVFHPGYLQVSVGLLIGSQPDAFVLCHDPLRSTITGWPEFPLPALRAVIERTVELGRLTNRDIRCAGISLNLSKVREQDRARIREDAASQTGLPACDPLLEGVAPIVDHLLRLYPP